MLITARTAAGATVQSIVPLRVNRTLGLVTTLPAAFSPNGDGRKDRLTLTFTLAAPADVVVRIERDGRWVATPLTGAFDVGTQRLVWDGSRAAGTLRDGEYSAVVEATNELGVISYGVPFVSDTVAPRVRFLPGKRLALEVSEPAVLTLVIDGRSLRREVSKAGTVRIPGAGAASASSRRCLGCGGQLERSRRAHPPRVAPDPASRLGPWRHLPCRSGGT